MCGIAGTSGFGAGEDGIRRVRRMISCICHRGPDDAGILARDDVCLGHARLEVIDLVSGAQPMRRHDLSVSITYNGEIYNYIELREELRALGHRFDTASDTEVILAGYRSWGNAVASRLRGMFAFVIYDERDASLFGARDPFGKKPLVYWHRDREFAFASELKSLVTIDSISRSVDPVALSGFLEQLYVGSARTIFEDAHKVAPGHWFRFANGVLKIEEYWSPVPAAENSFDFEESVCALDSILSDSVKLRMRADVPVGIFLSGGVDSSLVAAVAASVVDRPLKTFSVRIQGSIDESAHAAAVAAAIGSDHTRIDVPAPDVDRVMSVLESFDEPFGDSSSVPMSLMSEVAKRHVTVVLSGDGGDELFGGYGSYQGTLATLAGNNSTTRARNSHLLRTIRAHLPAGLEPTMRQLLPLAGRVTGALPGMKASADPLYAHTEGQRIRYEPPLSRLLRPHYAKGINRAIAHQREEVVCQRGLDRVFEYDIRNYLVGDILHKVDMTSMAWGLEARAPLLDIEVGRLALRIPASSKVSPTETKRPLKALLVRRLGSVGAAIASREKTGFGAPLASWLADPAMATIVTDMLMGSTLASDDLIHPAAARDLVRRFQNGRSYLAQQVWNLLALEIWCRQYSPWRSNA